VDRLTATVTATAAMDTNGQQGTSGPVTWFYVTGVRSCPRLPLTTDQKVGGSSPSERASLASGNPERGDLLTGCGRLNDRNRDCNAEQL
jgi:hypothetical protein